MFCSNKDNFSFEEFTARRTAVFPLLAVSGIETLYPEVTLSSMHEVLVGTFTLGHCHRNDTWPRLWCLGCHVPQTSTFVSADEGFHLPPINFRWSQIGRPVSGSHHLFACWRHLHIDWTLQEHDAAEAPRPPRHPHKFLSQPSQAWHQLIYQRLVSNNRETVHKPLPQISQVVPHGEQSPYFSSSSPLPWRPPLHLL